MGLISIINRGDVCKCRLRMEIANFFTRAGHRLVRPRPWSMLALNSY